MNQNIRFCTTADGTKLAYAATGEGPPLVMAATWLTHLEHQWRSLAWRPWLEALSGEHKLLRYDCRGCGLSDRDATDLSFEMWIQDFARIIEAAAPQRFAGALQLDQPTPRERAVLERIAEGSDNSEIAAALGLSEKSVRNHITRIFDKICVEHRYQAIVLARDASLGTP